MHGKNAGGNQQEITDLGQLLDKLAEAAAESNRVSLGMIMDALGNRSFAPLLLLAGLVTLAPLIGDIPGVPTIMALVVLLVAGQLLFHRKYIWLPRRLLDHSVSRDKLNKALRWMQRPAHFIDRLLRPRLTFFTGNIGQRVIAITCIAIAIAMPPMELVPFSANGAGLALTAFGLALIANDGLLALIAFIITVVTVGLVTYGLL